jgi:predicted phage terminase large subunit-like protein
VQAFPGFDTAGKMGGPLKVLSGGSFANDGGPGGGFGGLPSATAKLGIAPHHPFHEKLEHFNADFRFAAPFQRSLAGSANAANTAKVLKQIGDLLHPAREARDVLDDIKTAMGSATFAAQYQQAPVPPGGNMIDWGWFRWYEPNNHRDFEEIVISWDTAMKATELSDYSVGTVWGIWCGFYYLLDLIRVRLDYPALRRKITELYYRHPRPTVLIEDAGSGTSLIQDLKDRNIRAIPIKPDGDKVVRMAAQSAKIEAGEVCLPRHAKWLDDLRTEILAFPHGVHDDQVDSISQALSWMSRPKRQIFAVVA